ncbi:MAG: hypothetical protein BGO96_06425 [Micrococcales bacterium 73-15]|nr:MAG: hypothetical protein BGO96_06425 [Micrococcales bacterium 73-15]
MLSASPESVFKGEPFVRTTPRRLVTAVAAASILALLSACGGSPDPGGSTDPGAGDQGSAETSSGSTQGPADGWTGGDVTVTLWHDNAAIQPAVDLFNEAHAEQGIQIEFTETTDLVQAVRNAVTAGTGPDAFVTQTADLASFISEGTAADITDYYGPLAPLYSDVVNDAVTTGGRQWAVPAAQIPTFMIYNADIWTEKGLEYPTTYEDFLEAGKTLAADGISIFNIAGEDPTTFIYMAWEAGARWYELDGDSWTIDIDSDETRRTAEYFDAGLEAGIFSKISYAEYAAMMQAYNDGQIATRQLSTWQTKGMQANLTTGLGAWDPQPNLEWADNGPANAAFTRVFAVNSASENIDAAVYATSWLSTNAASIEALGDPEAGLSWFPAVADATPYIGASLPEQLVGEHADNWQPVVENAVATQKGDWTYGPNWAGAFLQLQDLWGKAVAGQIKTVDIAPALQQWVVEDLKAQGINVTE